MSEWGIFSDEGLIEGGFYSKEEAEAALSTDRYYDPEDGLEVFEICPEHPEQTRIYCDECDTE